MKVEVRFHAVAPSPDLVDEVTRQVHFHLSRFAREVEQVWVKLSDVNGPRGGVDQRCQVQVRGPRIESTVEAMSADPTSAADLALERCAATLGHSVGRSRAALRVPRRAARREP